MTYRVGVIGLSRGLHHITALKSLKDKAAVTSICDVKDEALERAKKIVPQAKVYKDFRLMLDEENLDGVIIATPTYLHAPMTIYACEKHVNVLVEKPMAMNSKECDLMIDAAKRYSVKIQVGFNGHYVKQFQKVRSILKEGRFGELLNVYSCHIHWGPENFKKVPARQMWFYDKKMSGGGCLIDLGVHMIEANLSMIGDLSQVFCLTHTTELRKKQGIEVEDVALSLVRFKSGAPGVLECAYTGFTEKTARSFSILSFPWASIETSHRGYTVIKRGDPKIREENVIVKKRYRTNTDVEQAKVFISCIEKDKEPEVSGKIGKRVAEIVDAMYESSEKGQTIYV